jgi:hypothetical protein
MHKNKALAVAVVLVLVAAGVGFFVAMGFASSNSPTVSRPTFETVQAAPDAGIQLPVMNMDGDWRAEDDGTGTQFNATVFENTINIKMVNTSMSVTYWNGTFQSSVAPGKTVVSTFVDPETVVLSSATSKEFAIDENGMTFDFIAMGLTKKVRLVRA